MIYSIIWIDNSLVEGCTLVKVPILYDFPIVNPTAILNRLDFRH